MFSNQKSKTSVFIGLQFWRLQKPQKWYPANAHKRCAATRQPVALTSTSEVHFAVKYGMLLYMEVVTNFSWKYFVTIFWGGVKCSYDITTSDS